MSNKEILIAILGGFTTIAGSLIAWVRGRQQEKVTLEKTLEEVKGDKLDNLIKVNDYNQKNWVKMREENVELRDELEKAYARIEKMSLEIEEIKNQFKKALEKIQEQQVQINLHNTIN